MAKAPADAVFQVFFGVGAIIFLSILYGGMGFIAALIGAYLYNGLAVWMGGIELELE